MAKADELMALTQRLREAEATLEAIRSGNVDALVVEGDAGQLVYTLERADLPYRQFLEQMNEGAVSLDADGHVLYCNAFFAGLVGAERDEVLGSSFEDVLDHGSLLSFREALEHAQPSRLGVNLVVGQGRRVPVQLAITPSGVDAGKRYTLVVSDLSERERLAEVTQGREAAEAASLAKDQFLAAVCHELRSPLNAVLGWTHMLLEARADLTPQTQRALEVIDRNARMQAKLIEDLLDVSRVVSGKLSLERSLVDVAEVARGAVASLLPQASAKGVSLLLRSSGSVWVQGDAQRLLQVLLNVLGNALKFTPAEGNIEVSVRLAGGRAQVVVKDDGAGIERALLPRVFQLFRQGTGRAGRRGGLGLGLSISRHLMELHEGSIAADSEGPGKGSTFTLELPAVAAPELAPSSDEASTPALSGLRALLVDDEADTRELTARVLRKAGAEVVAVADAAAALARLDADRFDLIVSDLMMPGTSGWELARVVRTRHGTRVPLLAVTSLDGPEQRTRAHEAGFDAFITKPLEESSLAGLRGGLFSTVRRVDVVTR
jgi:PAS domain S-box-containing protein